MKMKRKLFSMTEIEISFLKKQSENYQVSQSEILRRALDFYIDNYEKIKGIQISSETDSGAGA